MIPSVLAAVLPDKDEASVELRVVHRRHRVLRQLGGGKLYDAAATGASRALREHVSPRDLAAGDEVVLKALPGGRPREVANENAALLVAVGTLALSSVLARAHWLLSALFLLCSTNSELPHGHHRLLTHGHRTVAFDEFIQKSPELNETRGRDNDRGAVVASDLRNAQVTPTRVLSKVEEDPLLLHRQCGPPDIDIINHTLRGLFHRWCHTLRHPPISGWFSGLPVK
mmetsp:Transcript_50293/g.102487  ORF Transcript_50293/g.102487 Transcript_50293/m.102487 type:complete len:227 (-) Transcript_50293:73-753(-)